MRQYRKKVVEYIRLYRLIVRPDLIVTEHVNFKGDTMVGWFKLPDKKGYVFCKSNGFKFTGDYFGSKVIFSFL